MVKRHAPLSKSTFKTPFLTNFVHAFLMLNVSFCRGLEKKVYTLYVKSLKKKQNGNPKRTNVLATLFGGLKN